MRDMPPMSETVGGARSSEQNLKKTQPLDQGRSEANMANETTDGQGRNNQALTIEAARAKLAGQTGKTYWRSLDELADTPAFRETLQREFPAQAAEWIDPVSRRGFLKVMGASLALAGLSGCTKQPDEPIYPYVKEPEDLVLGRPVYFATAFPFNTGAVPLLVKSDAYRPIKLDGNPDHPVNRGTSDPLTQGSLLDLYDPDRSQRVSCRGETRQFAAFLAVFRAMLSDKKASGGTGLYVLSDTVTSPTLAAQWKAAQQTYPNAKWLQWDPINRDSAYAASKTAFGDYYDAQYRLQDADVIVSLDADFLSGITHPGFLRLAADYAGRRKLVDASSPMNRLYAVESAPSTTGFKAEHRLALKAGEVASVCCRSSGCSRSGRVQFAAAFCYRRQVSLRVSSGFEGERRQVRGHPRGAADALGTSGRDCDQPGAGQRREDGGLHRNRESDAVNSGAGHRHPGQ